MDQKQLLQSLNLCRSPDTPTTTAVFTNSFKLHIWFWNQGFNRWRLVHTRFTILFSGIAFCNSFNSVLLVSFPICSQNPKLRNSFNFDYEWEKNSHLFIVWLLWMYKVVKQTYLDHTETKNKFVRILEIFLILSNNHLVYNIYSSFYIINNGHKFPFY